MEALAQLEKERGNPAYLCEGKDMVSDRQDSRDLSKKIKSVKKLMQEKGAYSGGDVPYGYMRVSGESDVYVPAPEAARIVREIFLYAAGGDTTL